MVFPLIPAMLLVAGTLLTEAAPKPTGNYPTLEASFDLPTLTGNPFDYAENDIQVRFALLQGKHLNVPAFFDGGTTWRVRYTPLEKGAYRIEGISRNGSPIKAEHLTPERFSVDGKPGRGFVRIDSKSPTRFAFDNGEGYYPIGHNVAWKSGDTPDIAEIFTIMGKGGENWSRVWMNHWDNKNLDWPIGEKLPPGILSLPIARKWDTIFQTAEKTGIYFQLTMQHHGQYSSTVNPNWGENPWNQKNGGFLEKPEDFFTNPEAIRRTKAKYRYIVARWGYSPALLAWELFNEVQFTDAVRNGKMPTVAAWHKEMTEFLRAQDVHHHLVTTSSDTNLVGLYDAMDYVQPHTYPPDVVIAALSLHPSEWKKPEFFGEIGPGGDLNVDDGTVLHNILWASLMSEASGAAQYWTWDHVHRQNLYGHFAAAVAFARAAKLAETKNLQTVHPTVTTPGAGGTLTFAPGGGWGATPERVFPILADGSVENAGKMPAFLQGTAHVDMFPYAEFPVTLEHEAVFTVHINRAARAGAHVVLKRDGDTVAEQEFTGGEQDTPQKVTLSVTLPPGKHTIRLENTGADWVTLGQFTLSPFGATLKVVAKANVNHAILWLQNTRKDEPSSGTVSLPGMEPGKYHLVWWDTQKGQSLSESTVTAKKGTPLVLTTPEVTIDLVALLEKQR